MVKAPSIEHKILNHLKDLGIPYLRLSINNNETPSITDLDILVCIDDVDIALHIIHKYLETQDLIVLSSRRLSESFASIAILTSGNDGVITGLQVDIFTSLTQKGFIDLVQPKELLTLVNSSSKKELYTALATYSVIKEIVLTKTLRPKRRNLIDSLIGPLSESQLCSKVFQPRVLALFLLFGRLVKYKNNFKLQSHHMQSILFHLFSLTTKIMLLSASPVSSSILYLKHKKWQINRFIYPPGLLIVFTGVDGSGKSTTIQKLKSVLLSSTNKSIDTYHMFPKFFERRTNMGIGAPTTNQMPYQRLPHNPLISAIKLLWLSLEINLIYWTKIRYSLSKKFSIVILDRYIYDAINDPLRLRISLPLWCRRLWLRLCPCPDITYVLTCDPETAFARKHEASIEMLSTNQSSILRNLSYMTNAHIISSDHRIDDNIDVAIQILASYNKTRSYNRYGSF